MSVGRIALAALLVFCAHGTVAGSEGDGSFEAHESAWGGPGETKLAGLEGDGSFEAHESAWGGPGETAVAGAPRYAGGAAARSSSTYDLRQREYEARCAGCHGATGKGDGVDRPFLERSPANLTVLAKAHGGEFPYQEFYTVVEGRQAEGRDMPSFATVYAQAARSDSSDVPYDADRYLETRLVALADYVAGLQVK